MKIRNQHYNGIPNEDYYLASFSEKGVAPTSISPTHSHIVQVDVCVTIYLHYALTVNIKKSTKDDNRRFLNWKHAKKMKISVDWWFTTKHDVSMPSQRKIDKKQISVWIPIVLFRKFQKRARQLDMTMTEIITAYLVQQTQNIDLTPEDYENIAKEIREKTNNR